jgi:hypothetical protein
MECRYLRIGFGLVVLLGFVLELGLAGVQSASSEMDSAVLLEFVLESGPAGVQSAPSEVASASH